MGVCHADQIILFEISQNINSARKLCPSRYSVFKKGRIKEENLFAGIAVYVMEQTIAYL